MMISRVKYYSYEEVFMSLGVSFSIITATWNCSSTLSECLRSVAFQDYRHIQHLVIDGASTDGTIEVIKDHIYLIDKFKSEPDLGIYDALNKGLEMATGDVVGFMHADDLFASRTVISEIARFFDDPSVCAVYGDLQYVHAQDTSRVIRHWKSSQFTQGDLLRGWMPAHPTLYVRRDWYRRIGCFNISYRISADYLSVLKLFGTPDFKSVYHPEVLVKMRTGGTSNKSLKAILRKSKEDWRALRSCNFSAQDSMRAIAWKNLSKISQFAWFPIGSQYALNRD